MRRRIIIITFAAAALISLITLENACAYWIWTPETKKFVNPKHAVKDSPKEQFDWAMSFYHVKDYQKAAQEFEKLTKQYEYSEYASKAQYYVGLCYENMNKLYFAFQNYQKAIDNFPHIENMEEIIAREFNIANIYEDKANPKVLGTDIMTSTDRAVEIYKKVVDNAPFGRLADESQFRMGQAFKKAERYDEAIPAFQKILDDYPNSQFIDKAKFEVADCAYKASLKPAYDIESTDKAIKAFEDFGQTNRDEKLSGEAGKTIQRLKDKAAEKSFITAQFYESQRHYESAIIYYKDVVARFSDSSMAVKAKAKIEALGNRGSKNTQSAAGKKGEKKIWTPFNIPRKPKPPKPATVNKDVKIPKKSWQFFEFAKPAKKEKAEDASVPKPVKSKGWWNPIKFANQPKPKKEEAVPAAASSSNEKKKGWTPFSLAKPVKKEIVKSHAVKEVPVQVEVAQPKIEASEAKPAEGGIAATQGTVTTEETAAPSAEAKTESASAEEPAEDIAAPSEPAAVKKEAKTPKKSWTPFSFTEPAKKEKAEDASVPKPVKSKGWWNPLKFTSKPKRGEVVQSTDSSAKEKKGWVPFSFTKKPKPSEPAADVTAPTDKTDQ